LDGGSAGRKGQKNTNRINAPDINASSGIQTDGPSAGAGEDGSCLRPRDHCDQLEISLLRPGIELKSLEYKPIALPLEIILVMILFQFSVCSIIF
jgi:hypothetical protein